MNEKLTITQAIITIFASFLIILFTRIIPFVVFNKRNPPALIKFIEKFIPAMIMAILVIYCFKDVTYTKAPYGLPYFICVVIAAILHLCFKNSMLSILGTTVIYMILSRIIPMFF